MFEEFSGGYYRVTMNIQPVESGPAIEQGLYDFINRKFYYKTDAPITMRVGLKEGMHFQPSSEGAMPTDVLALPQSICDRMGVHPSAEKVSVYLLKPAHAYLFSQSQKYGEQFLDSANISDTTLTEEDSSLFNIE